MCLEIEAHTKICLLNEWLCLWSSVLPPVPPIFWENSRDSDVSLLSVVSYSEMTHNKVSMGQRHVEWSMEKIRPSFQVPSSRGVPQDVPTASSNELRHKYHLPRKFIGDPTWGLCWALICLAHPKFQTPRRKAGIRHKAYYLYKRLRHSDHSPHLGKILYWCREPFIAQVPGASEGPTM